MMKRTLSERVLMIGGSLTVGVAYTVALLYLIRGLWPYALSLAIAGTSTVVALAASVRSRPDRLYRGRVMFDGQLGRFVALFDHHNPYERWGIELNQRVEVRIVHDNISDAFDSYMTAATAATPTALADETASGVVGMDAVGGDVVAEPSDDD